MKEIENLKKKLAKVESELDKCRTSVLQDGWQTQRFAKKSRKWDVLALEKMSILAAIDDLKVVSRQRCPVNLKCLCPGTKDWDGVCKMCP